MKLKNILTGAFCALALLATASCSNIADDFEGRTEYIKPAEVGRTVLIEDFTGQRCINCPTGTDRINNIVETYGEDNVIAVGIHSGPLGFAGTSRVVGLMTDTGNEYYKYWDSQNKMGQPWALFNRSTAPNSDYNTWATKVGEIISKKAPMSIAIANTYDADTRQLTTDIDAYGTDGNTTGKLQVWLIEDGIVAIQYMPDGSANRDYVHNHVFRAAVNGTWGEDVTVSEGEHTNKQYTYTLPEKWNAEKVSVVAFVYNDNEVLQTSKKAVVATDGNDNNQENSDSQEK